MDCVGSFSELDTFENLLSLQPDPAMTAGAIPGTTTGNNEAPLQVPACVARGANCQNTNSISCTTGAGLVGCPGFREDAVRIYIQITDADDQCSDLRCRMFTGAYSGGELAALNIGFIGLIGTSDDRGTGTPRSVAESIGRGANSLDDMDRPFVYDAVDAAVVDQTVNAVRALAQSEFEVTIDAADEPDDDGDALRFIDYLEVNVSGMGACTAVAPTTDRDADGHDDTFPALRPGTSVCWDVVPVMNDIQEPADSPLVYKARLTVRANGSPVDSRLVFFLIPPRIEIIESPT